MGLSVKVISALWLAASLCASGMPDSAGGSALRFLEKTRARQLDLEPGGDTALSPQTSGAKRLEIARRLERMAGDLGSGPLEAGPIRVDDNVAGVLVRKSGGFDPAEQRVFAVAMVRRGDRWLAAPLPASFENTGLGYDARLRRRAAALEEWMLRQQVLDLASLREKAAGRLRASIERALPVETLRALNSEQAAGRFLTACGRRDLPVVLALLGGAGREMPDDWALRVRSATAAISARDVRRPWHLLVSGDVLRVVVGHDVDDGRALALIACLDPAASEAPVHGQRLELLQLELTRDADGCWRVDPPSWFLDESAQAGSDEDLASETGLLAEFPSRLAVLHPAAPEPTAAKAFEALCDGLRHGGFPGLVRLIAAAGDSAGPFLDAAKTWWTFHRPGGARVLVPLGFTAGDHAAAGICQVFSAHDPERADLRVFYFEKSGAGWLWVPRPGPAAIEPWRGWTAAQSADLQTAWRDRLLDGCEVVDRLPDGGAPSIADARAVVESWLKALAAGDLPAVLRLSARLDLPDSRTLTLRNLGHEFAQGRENPVPPDIASVNQGAFLTGVGLRRASDGKAAHPLHAVVATPAGPRVLIEIDLSASPRRSRAFLNRLALDRLRHLPGAADELQAFLGQHQTSVGKPASGDVAAPDHP